MAENYEGLTVAEALAQERGSEAEVVEVDEEASPAEEVRESLGIGEGLDPLSAFLAVDTSKPPTEDVHLARLGIKVTVQAITDDKEYEQLVDRCTLYVKNRRGGGRTKELDGRRLSKLTVAGFTVNPAFHPKNGKQQFDQLAKKYGTNDPEILVERALLIGEIDLLAERILTISGFDDELEVAGN
jgi:hypothetical protein